MAFAANDAAAYTPCLRPHKTLTAQNIKDTQNFINNSFKGNVYPENRNIIILIKITIRAILGDEARIKNTFLHA